MMPTLGTSGPQRQVLYSASKGVNSSVGLRFFVVTYRKYLAYLPKKKKENFRFFCSHSVLPTKMTYGNLFVFGFWSTVGHSVLPTKINYGNLFIVGFLKSHSGWPY